MYDLDKAITVRLPNLTVLTMKYLFLPFVSRVARLKSAITHISKNEMVALCFFVSYDLSSIPPPNKQIISCTLQLFVTKQLVKKRASSMCHEGEASSRRRAGKLVFGKGGFSGGREKECRVEHAVVSLTFSVFRCLSCRRTPRRRIVVVVEFGRRHFAPCRYCFCCLFASRCGIALGPSCVVALFFAFLLPAKKNWPNASYV